MNTAEKNSENSIEALFEVGAHYGLSKAMRHPSVKPFIFGAKNKIEIFDLEKTVESLAEVKEFVRELGKKRAQILFVGGKREAISPVREGALKINVPFVAGRWVGGTLTNFDQIRKRVEKLLDLLSQREKGQLAKYTKKERLLIDREIERLQKLFEGLVSMKEKPAALFVIDAKKESIAVKEAHVVGIPVITLSSSDCNLREVDYAILANDSSVQSVNYFVDEIVSAYEEGSKEGSKKAVKKEEVKSAS